MTHELPEILTLIEAAEMLQISESTLQRIAKKGEVPGIQVGGQWRFDRDQLRAMVRGEWNPPQVRESGRSLVEEESLRLGVEIPETLHDMQRAAAQRLRDGSEANNDATETEL